MESLPLSIRTLVATEARLKKIYDCAARGLKGSSLAWAAGMHPDEYRLLCARDPLALNAEEMGRAHGELRASNVLHAAMDAADPNVASKAALEVLKHAHGWVAKQQVQVDMGISIVAALQQAEGRVSQQVVIDADTEVQRIR